MTQYKPHIHDRQSIRLKGYDYMQAGLYFITMNCYERARLFGKIMNGTMVLNDAGKIADACWLEIPQHFPHVILHEYVIMPDHVHGIIEILGANLNQLIGVKNFSPATDKSTMPRSPSKTIGSVVRGYKIGVTKWMRQNTNVYDVWQRNYYEHIIRNEKSYQTISNYIKNNPAKWLNDKF